MKHILVTTDFSEAAEAAFPYAAAWAKHYDGSVTVAYVVDSLEYNATYPYPDLTRFRSEIESAARQGLSRAADSLRALGAPRVKTVYRVGTPAVEIAALAEENGGFDLLITATHGATGFRRFLIGSVAESIVRRVPTAVLSVHTESAIKPGDVAVRKILVASDLSPLSDAAVHEAVTLAQSWEAEIEVAHVFHGPLPVAGMDVAFTVPLTAADLESLRGSFQRALRQQIDRIGIDVPVTSKLLEGNHAAEIISQYAFENGFDLVVAASHGRRGVKRFVMGSVAERLMRMSEVPVLVVKVRE